MRIHMSLTCYRLFLFLFLPCIEQRMTLLVITACKYRPVSYLFYTYHYHVHVLYIFCPTSTHPMHHKSIPCINIKPLVCTCNVPFCPVFFLFHTYYYHMRVSGYVYRTVVSAYLACSMNTQHSAPQNITPCTAQHRTPLLELLQNPFEDCMHGTVTRPWVPAPTPPLHACPPSSLLASVL